MSAHGGPWRLPAMSAFALLLGDKPTNGERVKMDASDPEPNNANRSEADIDAARPTSTPICHQKLDASFGTGLVSN